MKYLFDRSYYVGAKFSDRMVLYNELTPQGKWFVDEMARELERNFKARRHGSMQFGVGMGRELALALLEHFWSGELVEVRGETLEVKSEILEVV